MLFRKLALSASITLALMGAANAADLGGDCCADLSDRVADLESAVARKGTRKVTVVISGTIDKAFLYTKNLTGDRQYGVIDNSASPTAISISGEGKISPTLTAGYRIELGIDSRPAIGGGLLGDEVVVRHNFVYLDSKDVGRFSIGHTSMATDKLGSISVANTEVASRMLSLAPLSTTAFLGVDLAFNDVRRNLVRYDSPVYGGFTVSASLANGDQGVLASGFNPDHAWDIGLRFAAETKDAGGLRFAAGVGYRNDNNVLSLLPFAPITRDKVYVGSASLMHMATGLFVNVAGGRVISESLFGGADFDAKQVQAGWEYKFNSLGKTTLFAEWGQLTIDGSSAKPNIIGVGLVQNIENAAMDLYVDFKQIDLDTTGVAKAESLMVGARLRF